MTLNQHIFYSSLCLFSLICWSNKIPEAEYLTKKRLIFSRIWYVYGQCTSSCFAVEGGVFWLYHNMIDDITVGKWPIGSNHMTRHIARENQEPCIFENSLTPRLALMPCEGDVALTELQNIQPLSDWLPLRIFTTRKVKLQAYAPLGDRLNPHAKQSKAHFPLTAPSAVWATPAPWTADSFALPSKVSVLVLEKGAGS